MVPGLEEPVLISHTHLSALGLFFIPDCELGTGSLAAQGELWAPSKAVSNGIEAAKQSENGGVS